MRQCKADRSKVIHVVDVKTDRSTKDMRLIRKQREHLKYAVDVKAEGAPEICG